MELPPQPNLERLWTGEVGRENVEEAESMIKKWRGRRVGNSPLSSGRAHMYHPFSTIFKQLPPFPYWYVFGWTGYLVE